MRRILDLLLPRTRPCARCGAAILRSYRGDTCPTCRLRPWPTPASRIR